MSGGLVKACVQRKKCSVSEKIEFLINIIYFTLGTIRFEFKCYVRAYGFLGKTFSVVLHHSYYMVTYHL